jgi:hypothetical protein
MPALSLLVPFAGALWLRIKTAKARNEGRVRRTEAGHE